MATVSYKCANCGGGLKFDPQTQQFTCEFCMSSFTEEQLKDAAGEHEEQKQGTEEVQQEPQQQAAEDSSVLYQCPSCGAEIITDETTAATFCFYCHNPIVLAGRLEGKYLPDAVIPFTVSREQAIEKFLEWARKKKFVPKDFTSEKQIEKITGIYFPHWMVDGEVSARLQGEAVKIRKWRTGDTEFTERNYYHYMREGDVQFNEIVRNALTTEHLQLLQSVQPFETNGLKKFMPAYLSGFQAEKRNVEREQLDSEVKQEIGRITGAQIRSSVKGYTTIVSDNVQLKPRNESWRYMLFPVWILTYRGEDNEIYYFAMNGQSGKVNGNLPLDRKKLFRRSAVVAGITFLLGLITLFANGGVV